MRKIGESTLGEGVGHAGERCSTELLANKDPRRFDELYAGLSDGVRAKLEELSPLAGDEYFPLSETNAIGRIAPQARVTVSGALDHVEPVPSLRDLPAFLRINGFVVRSLREARL
jgi:hypothetical protein